MTTDTAFPIELTPSGTHWTLRNTRTDESVIVRPRVGRLLFALLLSLPNLALTRNQLHARICPNASPDRNNVDVAVHEARTILKRLGVGPILRTYVGVGYGLDFTKAEPVAK